MLVLVTVRPPFAEVIEIWIEQLPVPRVRTRRSRSEEIVVPDLVCGTSLFEEEHAGTTATAALACPAWKAQDRVQSEFLEELSLDAPEEGAELSSFEMGMGLRFRVMVISSEAVTPLLTERLSGALPEGESAVDYELGAVSYTIEAYDIATETAVIRAEASVIKL